MTSKITGMDKSQQKHDGCAFHFEHKYSIFTSVRLVRWEKNNGKEEKSSAILVYFEWNHMQFDETLEKTDIGYFKKYIYNNLYTFQFLFNMMLRGPWNYSGSHALKNDNSLSISCKIEINFSESMFNVYGMI